MLSFESLLHQCSHSTILLYSNFFALFTIFYNNMCSFLLWSPVACVTVYTQYYITMRNRGQLCSLYSISNIVDKVFITEDCSICLWLNLIPKLLIVMHIREHLEQGDWRVLALICDSHQMIPSSEILYIFFRCFINFGRGQVKITAVTECL